jgi:hypothetical protein
MNDERKFQDLFVPMDRRQAVSALDGEQVWDRQATASTEELRMWLETVLDFRGKYHDMVSLNDRRRHRPIPE